MTREDIEKEKARIEPIYRKIHNYLTSLQKELDNLDVPPKTLEECKVEVDIDIKATEIKVG